MPHRARRCAVLAVFVLLAGCSGASIKGKVTDERGSPIGVPGARVSIGIDGVADSSSEKVNYGPAVKPDGTYEAKVVGGTYHPIRAVLEVPWLGATQRFELDPVQDNRSDRESKGGIQQDFVWKLSGPHFRYAQAPDPTKHTHWYGGSIRVRLSGWRNDLNRAPARPAEGTKYVFTLKPRSRRIDGSEAKELQFERTWDARGGELDNGLLSDVPIAQYTLTGVEVAPGGGQRPLVFETSYAKFEPEAKVDFPYDEILHGPHIHAFDFDR